MTISSTTVRSGPYTCDGVVTTFNRGFRIDDEDDLVVINLNNGVETVVSSGFSHTGVGSDSGSIVFTTAPTSGQLYLIRNTARTQTRDYSTEGTTSPADVEADLDDLQMQVQELDEVVSRSIRLPRTTVADGELPSSDRASTYVAFDASGNPTLIAFSLNSGTETSAFVDTLLALENAAALRSAIGAQEADALLDDLAGLTATNGGFIVGDGSNFVIESGSTARTSLGLSSIATYDVATLAQVIAGTASKAIDAALVASMVGENALTSATSVTVDMANKQVQTVTLAHNATFANPTNVPVGHSVRFDITQDGTGSRTAAWGSYYKFPASGAPTLSTTADKMDTVAFRCKSATELIYEGIQQEFTL